ncbi:hypothetical protein F66182_10185 [Fusarium sp. NRRL 66182]|nr:hypothetical protein F66182_10185 [Fusarium sp. NRRL 66182]
MTYYGGNHPPPLFAVELDSQPGRPSDTPAHHTPDGTPVYEMSSEPVLAQQMQIQDTEQSSQWPSALQTPASSKPAQQGETQDKPNVIANPWAYFGPESPEKTAKQGQRPQLDGRRPSEPVYKPYPGNGESAPQVPHGTRPSAGTSSPDNTNDDTAFYPAPLKLAHRPANAASPPAFKPYAPPVSEDTQDLQPKPLDLASRTNTQSTTASAAYRPYRPHSPQPPAAPAALSSNVRPATASPPQSNPLTSSSPAPSPAPQQQSMGAAPHHFHSPSPPNPPVKPPASNPSLSPRPTASLPASPGPQPQPQHGIPDATQAQPVPSSASTYLPSPMSPSAQLTTAAASSPATPSFNPGVPVTQPQYAAHVPAPTYGLLPAAGATSPTPAASSLNHGVPFAQPQYASPVQAQDYTPNQPSKPPVTSAAAPSQAPVPAAPTPVYNLSQPTPAPSNYSIPQPTYAPAQSPASANPTPGGLNQPSHPPAPYQQASHSGPEPQQPYPLHSSTEPYHTPASTAIPQSPPPPYAPQDVGTGSGAKPPTTGNPMPYSPSSIGPCPPQSQYPIQPTYAPTTGPFLQGQPTYGLQPPALPPRPSSSQGFTPGAGFGAGPAGYNPIDYPRPPQTYFQPPPALPPRPEGGMIPGSGIIPGVGKIHSGGKLFGSSSADKWLRKTGQVLESTLAPYLQGQTGSYRPGTNGSSGQQHGQQGQQGQQIPQGHHFHAPHLAPQFSRGAPDSEPSPPGPGVPGH